MDEQLVLVDADDTPVGMCGKMQVHREGLLHRAFSIFVFDSGGRLLLQQRAFDKYHSGGLWTNTCCGHPRPDETLNQATHRRLKEEMGFTCELQKVDTLLYRASLANGLVEHEFTHIHVGVFGGLPTPDPAEAAAWRWIDVSELVGWLDAEPTVFTVWFRYMVERAGAEGLLAWAREFRISESEDRAGHSGVSTGHDLHCDGVRIRVPDGSRGLGDSQNSRAPGGHHAGSSARCRGTR